MIHIAQYQWHADQCGRAASGAEAASTAGTHRAQWSCLAVQKITSLMTGSRMFLSESNRACGKRAVRVLHSGPFKAYLLVGLSRGGSAQIPAVVSSVAKAHLN